MEFRFVEFGSAERAEASQLRYSVFFQPLGLPPSVMDDGEDEGGVHLVAVTGRNVVGYARLHALGNGDFRVSQMVVAPDHQGEGVGRRILNCLVNRARDAGGTTVKLDARVSAAGFYLKAGFEQSGEIFASGKTGIPHIRMILRINAQRA